MTISLNAFIKLLRITTKDEGRALWDLIANKEVFVNGDRVTTGSFRYNGGEIAEICGGTYMDYYCAVGTMDAERKMKRLFKRHGVVLKEIGLINTIQLKLEEEK